MDVESMEALYQTYAQTVYRYLFSLCRSADLAEELTQETFYQAIRTIDRFDGTCAVYANLASMPAVSVGDWVQAGDVIGAVGTTALCEIGQGTHLHFAVYLDGESVDPLDYLPA